MKKSDNATKDDVDKTARDRSGENIAVIHSRFTNKTILQFKTATARVITNPRYIHHRLMTSDQERNKI